MTQAKSVLLALALSLTSAVPGSAHFADRQRSFSAYVEGADLVVRGIIDGVEQALAGGHAQRDGRATVRVEEALKGEAAVGSPLQFTTTGVHQPRYRNGEHVVLFLNRTPGMEPPVFVTRQSAIEGIGLDGPDGPALLGAVRTYVSIGRSADPRERLARLTSALLTDLESQTPVVWQNALFDLSKRADLPLDRDALVRLETLALGEERSKILRVGCVAKLAAVGKGGHRVAAQTLARIVRSKSDPFVRSMAATALEETRAPLASPTLVGALEDSSAPVRRAAAEGLGRLRADSAVDPLARVAAADENRLVRFAALKSIARIGGTRAEAKLRSIARNPKYPGAKNEIELARRQVELAAKETNHR